MAVTCSEPEPESEPESESESEPGEEARLGAFEFAVVLGRFKAEPLA